MAQKLERIDNCCIKADDPFAEKPRATKDDVVPGDNTFQCPVKIKWVELAIKDGKIICMDKGCIHSREYIETDGGLV